MNLIILILCVTIWIFIICHYRLKYRIATLKQFNSIDQASICHHICRQPSIPSYIDPDTGHDPDNNTNTTQLSLDVTHTYDYNKDNKQSKRQSIIEGNEISANSINNLTMNRLRLYRPSYYHQDTVKLEQDQARRGTISIFDVENNQKQNINGHFPSKSNISNDESLVSYVGLSKQSSTNKTRVIARQISNEETKDSYFPCLTKQKTPSERLLANNQQIGMNSISILRLANSEDNKVPNQDNNKSPYKTKQFQSPLYLRNHLPVPTSSSPRKLSPITAVPSDISSVTSNIHFFLSVF